MKVQQNVNEVFDLIIHKENRTPAYFFNDSIIPVTLDSFTPLETRFQIYHFTTRIFLLWFKIMVVNGEILSVQFQLRAYQDVYFRLYERGPGTGEELLHRPKNPDFPRRTSKRVLSRQHKKSLSTLLVPDGPYPYTVLTCSDDLKSLYSFLPFKCLLGCFDLTDGATLHIHFSSRG